MVDSAVPDNAPASHRPKPVKKMEHVNALLVAVVFVMLFLSYFVNHRIARIHVENRSATFHLSKALQLISVLPVSLDLLLEATQKYQNDTKNQDPIREMQRIVLTLDSNVEHLAQHTLPLQNSPQLRDGAAEILHTLTYGHGVVAATKRFLSSPDLNQGLDKELMHRIQILQRLIAERQGNVLAAIEQVATQEHTDASRLLTVQYGVLILVPPILAAFLLYQMVLSRSSEKMETERAWYIQELEAQKFALETQGQELARTRDEAIMASKAKSAFLANMSHEIRTPLTAIIGFSDVLLTAPGSAADRFESTHTINRSAKHLLQIINDLLDLSKIEADKLQLESVPCSPFSLVEDVTRLCVLQADQKGIQLSIDFGFPIPSRIVTDPLRLKQVLLNITHNAIKFTNKGSVAIRCTYLAPQQQLRFVVSDTGIGIPQQYMGNLFTAFAQADQSTTRRFGGTGLGLALCKRLVQLLGGDITATSTEGVGTTIDFTVSAPKTADSFPIDRADKISSAKTDGTRSVPVTQWSGHVLVAEDNPDNQKLIGLFLKNMGLTYQVVENGRMAVEAAPAGQYDLVLMDMQMPEMDGYDATAALRRQGYQTPIVALTANAMREDIERAHAAGCTGFLAKPIDKKKFIATVSTYMKPATARSRELLPDVTG